MKKNILFVYLLYLPGFLFFELKSMQRKEALATQLEELKKQIQETYITELDALIENLESTWLKVAQKITGKRTEEEINTMSADEFKKYLPLIKKTTANMQKHLLEDFFKNTPKRTFNIQNEKGQTILHLMISEGRNDFIQYLLDNEANITLVNRNGNSSLHLAVNNIAITNALLEKARQTLNPDEFITFINQQNKFGNTALLLAVENNNPEVIQALLNAGANPSISNNDGFTALHLAVLQEKPSEDMKKIIKKLLKAKADPTIITTSRLVSGKTRQNKSPLELAEKIIEDEKIIAIMKKYSKQTYTRPTTLTGKKKLRWSAKLTMSSAKEQKQAKLIQDLQELTQKLHALTLKLSA